ncbi:hypothetical protein BKA61DRAFT_533224 [Leptodontidium sp. MPI-SDFR-AT-0119]|nr:hypothetical protein BKA61DRAFT_533224 [Leptodontidium sp. MPI-SDFR-AT-0119]
MAAQVVLILGAGANVGAKTAEVFAKNGYKVALATRTITHHKDNTRDLVIQADFAEPLSIKSVFDEVKAKIGTPNVIVYNAAAANFNPDPFAHTVSSFAANLAVNTTSVYAAAKEAVAGFETLPSDTNKTFIFTGNFLPFMPMPSLLLDLGVGKSATAHLIQGLATVYAEKGFNFYFGDERKADGTPANYEISGENHANFYLELASKKEQGPWNASFVGSKYVDFSKK